MKFTTKTGLLMLLPCALAAAGCATVSSTPMAADHVTTQNGVVQGVTSDGVLSWKGIPFAAAPVGPLRWRAPQPAESWTGLRDASQYSSDCMQEPFPSDAAPLGTEPAEDCLYLNVWKPEGDTKDLPVMVWIYGGGFVNGGASPPTYSGAEIARDDVIFVSFNYRVGRFGTFAHPQLTAENADEGLLGNYGYLDQIAALNWVQSNIQAFGGDADNVTIIGESAGGMSIHALMTTPLAEGLFDKAVIMSGSDGNSMGGGILADAEKVGVSFAESKGIAENDPEALARLRSLSAEEVTDGLNMMALFSPGERTFSGPFVDGTIALDARAAYASGDFPKIPLMIGATSADIGGTTGPMVAGGRAISAQLADSGLDVFAYRFSYVAESSSAKGAGHATDIPFFFNTQALNYGDGTTARDNAMGATISNYVTNFAKMGDPNGSDLPDWPKYSRASDQIMDFAPDGRARAKKDPWGAEIDAATSANAR